MTKEATPMRVSDEMIDAACARAFVPPISDDRRADMRSALEAVLPMVRRRLIKTAIAPGKNRGGWSLVDEIFDRAFPEDRIDAAKGEGRR